MGLGFGFRVLRVLAGMIGFILGFGSFLRFQWVWASHSLFFGVLSQGGKFFIGILNIGISFENQFWSGQTAASLCRSGFRF